MKDLQARITNSDNNDFLMYAATEAEETCVFGNTTVARGQRVEEGCSKICICEAGGYLKCQPRCPPSDAVSGTNQQDHCVRLKDPR